MRESLGRIAGMLLPKGQCPPQQACPAQKECPACPPQQQCPACPKLECPPQQACPEPQTCPKLECPKPLELEAEVDRLRTELSAAESRREADASSYEQRIAKMEGDLKAKCPGTVPASTFDAPRTGIGENAERAWTWFAAKPETTSETWQDLFN